MQYHRQFSFFEDVYNRLPTYMGQHYVNVTYDLNEIDPDGDGLYMNVSRKVYDDNGHERAVLPADRDSDNKNAPAGLLNSYVNTIEDGTGVAHQTTSECYSLDLFDNLNPDDSLWNQVCTVYANEIKSILTTFGSVTLQFYKDELGVAFHSRYTQPQRGFGFANIYDFFFDFGTGGNIDVIKSMPFYSNGDSFIFWAWRGDYLNLGTGGEVGLYYIPYDRTEYNELLSMSSPVLRIFNSYLTAQQGESEEWWMVSPYELGMQLSAYTISENNTVASLSNWFPYQPQWWITAFNYHEWDVDVRNVWVVFRVDFNQSYLGQTLNDDGERIFDAFVREYSGWSDEDQQYWYIDEESKSVYLIWGDL